MDLLKKDFSLFDQLAEKQECVLTDTSFVETVVFSARAGIEMGPGIEAWLHNKRYKVVFFLAPIEATAVRMESQNVASQISQEVQEAYLNYGYKVIVVPSMSLEERCKFIKKHIHQGE
eukprot:GFUD01056917.1.p1 GENE.GFUD01056917.1~~GFUD01056917.1.p1  ORF type:complete len:118 (+),score=25.47 GFUD01056917.1:1-354(+)